MGVILLPMMLVSILSGISAIALGVMLIIFLFKWFIKGNIWIRIFIGILFIAPMIILYQIYLNNTIESQEINLIDIKQKDISLKDIFLNDKKKYYPRFIYSTGSIFYVNNNFHISQYDLILDKIQSECKFVNTGIWGKLSYSEEFHLVIGKTPYLIYLSDDERRTFGSDYTLNLEMLNLNTCDTSSIILDKNLPEKNLDKKIKGIKIEKISNLKSKEGEDYIIVFTKKKIYSYNLTQKILIGEIETNDIDIRVSGIADINKDGEDEVLLLDKYSLRNNIVSFNYNLQKISEINLSGLGHSPNYSNGLLGYNATTNTYIMSCFDEMRHRDENYYFSILNTDGKLLKIINYKKNFTEEIPNFSIVHSSGKELFLINRTLFDGNGNEINKLPDPSGGIYNYILNEAVVDIDNDDNDEIVLLNQKQSFFIKGFNSTSGFKYDYENYLQVASQDGRILFNKHLTYGHTIFPQENGFRLGETIFLKNIEK